MLSNVECKAILAFPFRLRRKQLSSLYSASHTRHVYALPVLLTGPVHTFVSCSRLSTGAIAAPGTGDPHPNSASFRVIVHELPPSHTAPGRCACNARIIAHSPSGSITVTRLTQTAPPARHRPPSRPPLPRLSRRCQGRGRQPVARKGRWGQ